MRIAVVPVVTSPQMIARPGPTKGELPALVGFAKAIVQTAHDKAQSQATFMLVQARDYLEVLDPIIDRAVAVEAIAPGVRWALEGTRLLARAAHSKIVALMEIPDTPPTLRMERHRDVKRQMDLVLARVLDAEKALREPQLRRW